jgi:DNA adenine methylase
MTSSQNNINSCDYIPKERILRWAGGKQKIIHLLLNYLPDDVYSRIYREPFVGAGSLFFTLQPEKAYLSDANEHLIKCYQYVRDNPELINTYIRRHASKTDKDYYYKIRDLYNYSSYSVAQAARFIYLNKTCFNGIFRVNRNGEFNVPYGWKEPPALPSLTLLINASQALKHAKLTVKPFEKAIKTVTSNDFIYLDPPYPPLNGTSYFTHYTSERFGEHDQYRLADLVYQLDSSKCKFMMTNADTTLIRKLYERFKIFDLSVTRYITCKSERHQVSELVVTNYDSFLKNCEEG